MSKKRRSFKTKHWPSRQENGITHVYPAPGARTTNVAEQDQARLEQHPEAQAFVREYITGEFAGVKLPDGMNLDDVTHVRVQRLSIGSARIPLTREMADKMLYGVRNASDLRTQFEEASQGHSDDPFHLPEDLNRLNMTAAAAGMYTAFIDYPSFVDREQAEQRALHMCATGIQMWPEMTNDYPLYRKTFVPAFLVGYRLGVEQINLADPDKQKQAVEMIKSRGEYATPVLFNIIQSRMEEVGAKSIYDLVQE